VHWQRLAAGGVTVAAAVAAGSLMAGGVGSAATTASRPGAGPMVRGTLPPQPSKAAIKAAGVTSAASPATDRIYLRITGVSGEVQDGPFTGGLNVLSWSWGLSSPPSATTQASDLNVMVPFDRAVPALETRAEDHTALTMQLIELASTNQKIREIDLTGAKVDAVQVSSSSGGGVPFVSVSFSYAKEQTTYWYTNGTGTQTTYKSCWDVSNGVDCFG
jgi:type VI protein secretion system component Hcp